MEAQKEDEKGDYTGFLNVGLKTNWLFIKTNRVQIRFIQKWKVELLLMFEIGFIFVKKSSKICPGKL